MKYRWDNKYLHWGVTAFAVVAASMLFYYGIFHMGSLLDGINRIFTILAPIIYGAVIAYVLSSFVNFMEHKIILSYFNKKNIAFRKRGRKVIRWVCVLLAIILMFILIYALVMLLLPQLIQSVTSLVYNFPKYANATEEWLDTLIRKKGWKFNDKTMQVLNDASAQFQNYLTTNLLPQMQDMVKNFSAGVFDVVVFLKNFLIGSIVSIYILVDKEIFIARSKMIAYAVLPAKWTNVLIKATRFMDRSFSGFITGKLLDSAIIGVLCYIGITILGMPYTLLISVVIGVTNIIPFFGPYLGAIPSAFLILLVNPIQCLYFIIFILILQQFDGNVLGPKILGDSTGLSSFMVIVAILVGSGMFGIPGMIVGVPVCAVVYAMIWYFIKDALKKHDMPEDMNSYYGIDCIDHETKEIIHLQKKSEDITREQKRDMLVTKYKQNSVKYKGFLADKGTSLRKKSAELARDIKKEIKDIIETDSKRGE
ncbi:MAG: AI-2E family transporter [Blautia sp.]|nr:AI-2E family transporter [Blautia sp.]